MAKNILIAALLLITSFLAYFLYKSDSDNRKITDEIKEARSLLLRSTIPLDRTNFNIYTELHDVIHRPNFPAANSFKDRFNKLDTAFKFLVSIDSSEMKENLNAYIEQKLVLYDTLKAIATHFSGPHFFWSGWGLTGDQVHKPVYKFGDTVRFALRVQFPPYLTENNYVIVDYSDKEFATKDNFRVTYLLPTKHFMKENEREKTVEFKCSILVKDLLTGKLQELMAWTEFTIEK